MTTYKTLSLKKFLCFVMCIAMFLSLIPADSVAFADGVDLSLDAKDVAAEAVTADSSKEVQSEEGQDALRGQETSGGSNAANAGQKLAGDIFGVTNAYANEGAQHTITFNANGGKFSDGTQNNILVYEELSGYGQIVYSHTSNINDAGTQNGNYANNLQTKDVVTIPGASSLSVTVKCRTYNSSDVLYIIPGEYSGSISSASGSYGQTAKLYGTLQEKTYEIDGDTVTFGFYSNASLNSYGYYAIVKAKNAYTVVNGTYSEPKTNERSSVGSRLSFESWNTMPDGSGQTIDLNDFAPVEDTTVYSQYGEGQWETCGSCLWFIDDDGCLWIKPKNGVSGTLAKWGNQPPWYITSYSSRIKKVVICQGVKALTAADMFANCTKLVDMDLSQLDTSDVTNMRGMFSNCASLTSFNASVLDTHNVTEMSSMFSGCTGLTSLDLSTFDTSKVTAMSYMFRGCDHLEHVNVSNFNTSKVGYMTQIFENCSSLRNLDLSSWDVSAIVGNYNFIRVFSGCSSLTELNISGWRFVKVTDLSDFFSSLNSIQTINISGIDTTNVTNMKGMFKDCHSLTNIIGLSDLDTTNVKSMQEMFCSCSSLTSISELSELDTSNVTNMQSMFSGCSSLTSIDLSGLNTSNVQNMYGMLKNCTSLTDLNISGLFNTKKCNYLGAFVSGDTNLSKVVIGENTKLNGASITNVNNKMLLPTPIAMRATGKWVLEENATGESAMTPEQMRDAGTVTPGTWIWQIIDENNDENVTSWTTCGTCEWGVDGDGCLWIRPIDGVSGTLENYGSRAPWYNIAGTVRSIIVKPGVKAQTCENMFASCNQCVSADVHNLDVSSCTSIGQIFHGCSSLAIVDMSGWNTANVTRMAGMFYSCKALQTIDLSSFNTSNVNTMQGLFQGCSSLASINISGFDTHNVQYMNAMFCGCESLTTIDVSGFDTSNVKSMASMFEKCKSLACDLDLRNFNTENVTSMALMFSECEKVKSIDASSFNTQNVTSMSSMFKNCKLITELDLSHFNTGNVTNMSEMFNGCKELIDLDISSFNTSKVTTMYSFLNSCQSLQTFRYPAQIDTSKVTNMSSMFNASSGCTDVLNFVKKLDTSSVTAMQSMFQSFPSVQTWPNGIDTVDFSNFNTQNLTNMASMFYGARIRNIDLTSFDTSKVTTMQYTFGGDCQAESIDVTSFDTSSCTTMQGMFFGCNKLRGVDVSGFNTSNVTNMSHMFGSDQYGADQGNIYITELDVSHFDTSKVTTMERMFVLPNIRYLDVSHFDTSNVTTMAKMFLACGYLGGELETLDVSHFNTSKVTNMYEMFEETSISHIDLSNFDTSNVTDISWMFYRARNLEEIDLSSFNTEKVTKMNTMFYECTSLKSVDISSFNTRNVTDINNMFYGCTALNSVTIGDAYNFKGNGNISAKSAAILPDPPANDSYSGSWVLEGDDLGTSALTATQMRDAGHVTPGTWVWQVNMNRAEIVFMPNGGVMTGNASVVVEREDGGAFEAVTAPEVERPGYLLIDWNSEEDGSGDSYQIGDDITPVGGQTLTFYARWRVDTRVQVVVNHYKQTGENVNPVFPTDYVLQESYTIKEEPGTEVSPELKSYEGYEIPEQVTVTVADDGSTVVNYLYNYLTLKIHFNGNGADSGMMPEQKILRRLGGSLTINKFARTGYTFAGWNTDPEGGAKRAYTDGQQLNVSEIAEMENLTLYAQWRAVPTLPAQEEGIFTITLHSGETVSIYGLPAGTTYEIMETDIPAGWNQTGTVGTSGRIDPNETKEAEVTNEYSANCEINLEAYKLFEGRDLREGEFTFILQAGKVQLQTATNGPVDMNEYLEDEETGNQIPNPHYGQAKVSFEPITYYDEGNYTYYIRESIPAPWDASYDPSVVYDEKVVVVNVNVVDMGGGVLQANVTYALKGEPPAGELPTEDEILLFTNRTGTGSLEIDKIVSSDPNSFDPLDDDTVFTFKVYLEDRDRVPVSGDFEYVKGTWTEVYNADEDMTNWQFVESETGTIRAGGTFTLRSKDAIVISGIPIGTIYRVEELDVTGYDCYPNGESGEIYVGRDERDRPIAEFINVPKGSTMSISKTVTGNLASRDKEFTFNIHLEFKDRPLTGVFQYTGSKEGYITLDVNGNGSFTLKHGETITIVGLPWMVEYAVTEEDYSGEGYITFANNASGMTSFDDPASVSFTNQYNAVVPTGIDLDMNTCAWITAAFAVMTLMAVIMKKSKKKSED